MITNVVILGAGGDLSARLLLPGLGIVLAESPDARVNLVGSGRGDLPGWGDVVRDSFESAGVSGPAVDHVLGTTTWVTADATSADDLDDLLGGLEGTTLLYLALSPNIAAGAIDALDDVEIPEDLVLAVEKPLGTDARSAAGVNEALRRLLPDEQVFRVDHFLGMPGVLRLLGLRFANRIFEPILNRDHVATIEIAFEEDIALEGRADFYEGTGATEDMLQSHLLQTMAVLMMNPPSRLAPSAVRAATTEVLRSARVWPGDERLPKKKAVLLGRYGAGSAGGAQLPAYVDEEGVDPAGGTETFVQAVLEVRSWRWAGVPVTLRSGKAMGEPRQEIRVRLRPRPLPYDGSFGTELDESGEALVIGFEDGSVDLHLQLADAATGKALRRVTLSAGDLPLETTAYANVMRWLLKGDTTFSVAGEAAEEGWRLTRDILAAWGGKEPAEYPAGSDGARVIDALTGD